MRETLNFEEVLKVLKDNLKWIIGLSLLGALVATLLTFFLLEPKYEESTQVIVSQNEISKTFTQQDIQASLQLINTYSEIMQSPSIIEEVMRNLNIKEDLEDFSKKIEVSHSNESQVLNVFVRDEDPKQAVAIANEIASVFQKRIPDIMNVDNVSILAKAELDKKPQPVSPIPAINIPIGLILGALIGLAIAFLRAFLDKRVQTEEEVSRVLDIPVIGSVAHFK
ncbi:YveK family protein [Macrococcus carouselicus]|uniref:Capsule biosynthesis protein n=1 Tax=Macrococcus carouselicus TaxID=69969 RepID=A0A9Q8CM15_9STAP|nr:Wzz/FepE/Etk N-terminal domain-containing protein [Macrococcus carouselicus]TDM03842.1 capsule biosynthesis protein [Macrococcus carouselicus]